MKGRSPKQVIERELFIAFLGEVLRGTAMTVREIQELFSTDKVPTAATVHSWFRALSEREYGILSYKRCDKIPGKCGQRESYYSTDGGGR